MKNEIQKFSHEIFGEIRTLTDENGNPLFVGKDVAKVLGYSRTRDAVQRHVDEDDAVKHGLTDALGRTQQTIFINESGLYALILSSKLPQAKAFKHWVTNEVLPQIRKTGGYIPVRDAEGNELTEQQMLQQTLMIMKMTLDQQDDLIESQSKLIKKQQPHVAFALAIEETEDSIYVSELAKLITRNGYEIGRTRLFQWMRDHGYIFKHSTEPMQEWVKKGILSTHANLFEDGHGGLHESLTTKITAKGQKYFLDIFMKAA